MVNVYEFEALVPYIHPSAYVHPSAVLIGDVTVSAGCYIGPLASLRGDIGRVVVESDANVQDCCVVHCFPGATTTIGERGHVGHGSVLHGCTIGAGALIGMRAVVMDEAVIGERAFVGAGSVVTAEFEVPPAHLAVGTPAQVRRELTSDELAWKDKGTEVYRDLARRSLAALRPGVARAQPAEATDVRSPGEGDHVPLRQSRRESQPSSTEWER